MDGYSHSAHLYDFFDKKENLHFFRNYVAEVGSVLDIGAGTGRIALPLIESGFHVTAVEPSSAMIQQLQDKVEKKPQLRPLIKIIHGTAAAFDLPDRFPLAILSGSFDHFMNDLERLASLKNIHRHLQPGGTLVFDVFLGLMQDRPLTPAGEHRQGEFLYKRFVECQGMPNGQSKIRLVYEIYQQDQLIEQVEQLSAAARVDRKRVESMLDESGFEIQNTYQDYQFTPYQEENDLWIVEAKAI